MANISAAADHGLLRNRSFLAIWAAQILSQVASNAITSALIVLVAEITKSNTSSSVLILLAIVPAVLFGIFAGLVVDRSDRRRVLVITNVLRAMAVAPLLFYGESVATAYIVSFLVAAITVFFVPAEAAMLPRIVRKRDLLVANSLFTFTFNGAFLVGFIILAPVIIALAGFQTLFIVTAVMFGGAAILCVTLPDLKAADDASIGLDAAAIAASQTRRTMGEALRYLRRSPLVMWSLIYIALTYTLVAVAGALAPGFVREVLGVGERNTVIIVAPAGIGVVAGLGMLNVVGPRLRRARTIGVGLIVTCCALLALAGARPMAGLFRRATSAELGDAFPAFAAIVALTAFVFGIAYAFITVPAMTMLQENLHDQIRGRIFGVLNMLVSVFSFLPLLVVGPIADIWGVAPVFVGASVIVAFVFVGGRKARDADVELAPAT